MVILDPTVRCLRRKCSKTSEQRCANTVQISPWAQPVRIALLILLRRSKSRCVHWRQAVAARCENLTRGPKI
jgi:hypothetical protein